MGKRIFLPIAGIVCMVTITLSACGINKKEEFNSKTEITVISREDGSGTRGAFVELFEIEKKNDNNEKVDQTTIEANITNSTSVVMSSVMGNQYAIGYISLGSLDDTVKPLQIDGVEGTAENIKQGKYKIARPFNIVTKGSVSKGTNDFITYILSTEGQQIVKESGYISQDKTKKFQSNYPKEKVVVAGSSSVSPVMEKLKEAYIEINQKATIEIQQSDSTTGMTSVNEGICDIGMASRALKDTEIEKGLKSTEIALDGIIVIVNEYNINDDLTSGQVKSIFTGGALTWNEVGE